MLDKPSLKERGLITTGYHLPYNPKLRDRARALRAHMTKAEKRLWYHILHDLPFNVLRQKPIDNYILDFYCPKLKLAIEVDGEAHYTEEGKSYDEERTAILESYGVKVLRVTNDDVLTRFAEVSERIRHVLDSENKP